MSADKINRKLITILSVNTKGINREVILPLVEKHHGQLADFSIDSLLAEFASVIGAVQCALEIQEELAALNRDLPEKTRIQLRIGIHQGYVIEKEGKLKGDGIDVAVWLKGLVGAGEICISESVYERVKNELDVDYEPLGEQSVMSIAEPVHAYRVLMEPKAAIKSVVEPRTVKKITNRLDIAKMVIMALLVIVGATELWHALSKSEHPKVEVASLQKMAFPLPDKPSIAVLPFDNMTGDPEQEYFADGFTEQIITSLAKIPSLFVIARNSSFTYKGKPVRVQQVSEELGVRYVLEGSIQRSGDQVRINAQLIDAISGEHLWADRYDRSVKDIFALQDEINLKILTALQVKLTTGEQTRAWAKGTKNLEAYLKLMQVRENVYQMNAESITRARRLVEETIALDPKYAEAYAWMGATHYVEVLLRMSKSPRDSLAQAIEWEKKALAIDNTLALAYARLGYLYVITPPHKYEEGIAALEKAVEMDPNAALSYHFLGTVLRYAGKPEEAIPAIKMAIRLEPFTPGIYYHNLGLSYLLNGDCEEAVKACDKGLERERANKVTSKMATAVYGECGKEEEARKMAKEVLRLSPKFSVGAIGKYLPYKNPKDLDKTRSGLKKAGL